MAKLRQQLANIASSTFPSVYRLHHSSQRSSLEMKQLTIQYGQGKKQSELTVKILGNDGKELKEGQDINVTMHEGKISVNVINPKRGKSGTFKVTQTALVVLEYISQVVVGNNQGECSTDVDVNIMDKPPEVGWSQIR